MAKKGRSLAELDAALGPGLDTTGPQATDRPGTSTAELAEQLRTKLKARNALPPGPATVAPNSLPAGVSRYGGSALAPLVVARRTRPQVRTAEDLDTTDAGLVGLTPATQEFLGTDKNGQPVWRREPGLPAGQPAPAAKHVDSPGAVPAEEEVPSKAPRQRMGLPRGNEVGSDSADADGFDVLRPPARPRQPAKGNAPQAANVGAGGETAGGGQGTLALDGPQETVGDLFGNRPTAGGSGASRLNEDPGLFGFNDGPIVEVPPERAEATPGAIPTEVPHWPGPFQFVTGPAGSGKTTLVRGWRQHDEGFVLCATTGIAAVNLGDAVTINATLRYSTTEVLEDMFVNGYLQGRMRKLRASGITRYGIDEVSMMGAKALTILTQAVEELNSDASAQMGHDPQIGITLIGDFLQLPPVKEDYAFESPEWPKYEKHTRKLDAAHRFAGDSDFITALRAIRVGDGRAALDILRPHIYPTQDRSYPGTMILGKNAQADRHNKLLFAGVPGESIRFKNITTGQPLPEWERNIPMWVDVKLGVRVMILANRYEDGVGDGARQLIYANGDCGVVVSAHPDRKVCNVRLERNGEVVPVLYNIRQNLMPNGKRGKKKDAYDVLGEIDYMPLRLAYCSTVHKSQGLTLDKVQVDISDPFFTTPAMTYVAFSRARSLEGLRIVGNPELLLKRCTVDRKVERWR